MRTFQYNKVMKNEPLVPRGLVTETYTLGGCIYKEERYGIQGWEDHDKDDGDRSMLHCWPCIRMVCVPC